MDTHTHQIPQDDIVTRERDVEISSTHNLCFTKKPLEVVFLDVYQGGDVRDIEAVVLHMPGLQVNLDTHSSTTALLRTHTLIIMTVYLSFIPGSLLRFDTFIYKRISCILDIFPQFCKLIFCITDIL